MTIDQFISQTTQRVGTGQCGELVDLWLVEGYDNHTEYATALQYWQNGIPGFVITSNPQPGDIACYNAHPGFPDGHIAIYAGNGEVFEQNADPDGSAPHLFARANTYLLGYLTKGNRMTHDQNLNFARTLRLLAGESVADANTHVEDDANHMDADPNYGAALALQLYNGEWQTLAGDATKYRQGVTGTVLAPGNYQVK